MSPRWQPMTARLDTPEGKALYKQRAAIIEPVFAQLFARLGRALHYRGTIADPELHLWAASHNLLKAIRARAAAPPPPPPPSWPLPTEPGPTGDAGRAGRRPNAIRLANSEDRVVRQPPYDEQTHKIMELGAAGPGRSQVGGLLDDEPGDLAGRAGGICCATPQVPRSRDHDAIRAGKCFV